MKPAKKVLNASEMGKLGGPARAKSLSAERLRDIARLGGLARQAKRRELVETVKE